MTSRQRERRYFTVMVVPHADGEVVSIRVPLLLAQVAVTLLVTLSIGGLVFVNSYLDMAGHMDELFYLRTVNRHQRDQFQALTREADALRAYMLQLADLDEQIRRLILQEPFSEVEIAVAQPDGQPLGMEIEGDPAARASGASEWGGLAGIGGGYEPQTDDIDLATVDPALADLADLQSTFSRLAEEYISREASLMDIREALAEEQARWEATPTLWPARGILTSRFGWRTSPTGGGREHHSGLDVAAPTGTPIVATAAGRVIFSGWQGAYGNMVAIDHGNGYVTRYAHNSRNAVDVGDHVSKGDLIAYVGSTGRSTGPHVHYEILHKGRQLNPWYFLNGGS